MAKLKVGLVGVSLSSYYAEEWDQVPRAIRGLEALSQALDFELYAIPEVCLDDESARAASRELADAGVDFLMIQNSGCSTGEQIVALSEACGRLGLWSTPEPSFQGDMQFNSMVSMSMFASIVKRHLSHKDLPYKWFHGHADDARFLTRFEITIKALKAAKSLAEARVGWIGGLAPGFYNMGFDETEVKKNLGGARIFSHEISEVVAMAKSMGESQAAAIARDATAAASEVQVSEQAMVKSSRLYLALKELAAANNYTALAVECWPQFQAQFEMAPCMSYSWLGSEDGLAVACEGDVMGALGMQMLNALTGASGSSTMLDLAALEPEKNMAMFWHCGVSPRNFANQDGIKWVEHTTLGRKSDTKYGVAGDQVFGAQETTITYLGSSASQMLVLGAQIVDRPDVKGTDGTRGWFSEFTLNQEPIDPWDLLNTITVQGLEHHFCIGQGAVTSELMELAAWLKLPTIQRVPYKDYLQIEGINA
jgi:hypothetical protein